VPANLPTMDCECVQSDWNDSSIYPSEAILKVMGLLMADCRYSRWSAPDLYSMGFILSVQR
jgi:hypothetical protein